MNVPYISPSYHFVDEYLCLLHFKTIAIIIVTQYDFVSSTILTSQIISATVIAIWKTVPHKYSISVLEHFTSKTQAFQV